MTVVFFDPGLDRTICLSNIYFVELARDAMYIYMLGDIRPRLSLTGQQSGDFSGW
jgi:hypothetical protein